MLRDLNSSASIDSAKNLFNASGIQDLFTCRVSIHERCHVRQWFVESNGVILSYLTLFRATISEGSASYQTKRLAHAIVDGGSLVNLVGQEN